jgi:hypothetical protein
MDTEVLGKILEMVGEAGEGAFALALVFLLASYFKVLAWLTATFLVLRTVGKLITSYTFINDAADALDYELKTDCNGYITDYSRNELLKRIKNG